MRTLPRGVTAALLSTALGVAGCSGEPADDDRPLIVATTTIVGELAAPVAGDRARLEVLMPWIERGTELEDRPLGDDASVPDRGPFGMHQMPCGHCS